MKIIKLSLAILILSSCFISSTNYLKSNNSSKNRQVNKINLQKQKNNVNNNRFKNNIKHTHINFFNIKKIKVNLKTLPNIKSKYKFNYKFIDINHNYKKRSFNMNDNFSISLFFIKESSISTSFFKDIKFKQTQPIYLNNNVLFKQLIINPISIQKKKNIFNVDLLYLKDNKNKIMKIGEYNSDTKHKLSLIQKISIGIGSGIILLSSVYILYLMFSGKFKSLSEKFTKFIEEQGSKGSAPIGFLGRPPITLENTVSTFDSIDVVDGKVASPQSKSSTYDWEASKKWITDKASKTYEKVFSSVKPEVPEYKNIFHKILHENGHFVPENMNDWKIFKNADEAISKKFTIDREYSEVMHNVYLDYAKNWDKLAEYQRIEFFHAYLNNPVLFPQRLSENWNLTVDVLQDFEKQIGMKKNMLVDKIQRWVEKHNVNLTNAIGGKNIREWFDGSDADNLLSIFVSIDYNWNQISKLHNI